MSLTYQPPEKQKKEEQKNAPLEKPSGTQIPAGKSEEKKTLGKEKQETPTKQAEPEAKETAPARQPELPFNPPPGANQGAAPKPPAGPHQIGTILEPALWLIGILTLGAILIAWLKKSREKPAGTVAVTAHDQLTSFRQSVDEGDMTDEEFKKVKALLAEKIRKPVKPVTTETEKAQGDENASPAASP